MTVTPDAKERMITTKTGKRVDFGRLKGGFTYKLEEGKTIPDQDRHSQNALMMANAVYQEVFFIAAPHHPMTRMSFTLPSEGQRLGRTRWLMQTLSKATETTSQGEPFILDSNETQKFFH